MRERPRRTNKRERPKRKRPDRRRRENLNEVSESGEGGNQENSELRFYYTHENGPTHLTQKGFKEIKYDWEIARTIFESGSSAGRVQDVFPEWAKYIPGLVETLTLLVKDENVRSKDLHSALQEAGFMIDDPEEATESETPPPRPHREEKVGRPEGRPRLNLTELLKNESKQILEEEGLDYNEDEYGSPEPEERERREKESNRIGNLEWGKNTETGWKVDYQGNLHEVDERSESDIIVQTKERDSSFRTRLLFECSVNHKEAIIKLLDKYKRWTNETDETNVFIYVEDSPYTHDVLGHFSRDGIRTSDWDRDLSRTLGEIEEKGSAMIKERQEFVSDIINHARKDDDYEKNEGFRNTISIQFSS